jgi:hypothetical protein
MFENQNTLQNFLRNVSEVTKVGGYFIGTSYDGKLMFNMLRGVKEGDKMTVSGQSASAAGPSAAGPSAAGSKVWEVTKRYERNDFPDNVSCLGYKIDVYQESINKTFSEYLVNYEYLTQLLENYGFVLLKREELGSAKTQVLGSAKTQVLGSEKTQDSTVTESSGLFSDLFTKMTADLKRNPRLAREFGDAANMSSGERQISFLNRYFIYKKVRKVDTENVFPGLTNKTLTQEKDEEDESKRAQEQAQQAQAQAQAQAQQIDKTLKVKGKTKKVLKLVETL